MDGEEAAPVASIEVGRVDDRFVAYPACRRLGHRNESVVLVERQKLEVVAGKRSHFFVGPWLGPGVWRRERRRISVAVELCDVECEVSSRRQNHRDVPEVERGQRCTSIRKIEQQPEGLQKKPRSEQTGIHGGLRDPQHESTRDNLDEVAGPEL